MGGFIRGILQRTASAHVANTSGSGANHNASSSTKSFILADIWPLTGGKCLQFLPDGSGRRREERRIKQIHLTFNDKNQRDRADSGGTGRAPKVGMFVPSNNNRLCHVSLPYLCSGRTNKCRLNRFHQASALTFLKAADASSLPAYKCK